MDWNERYEKDDTPWERGEPAPPLVEYLEGAHPLSGSVLVPGCGLGHDARLLAAQGCEVVGVDISSTALQRAKAHPAPPKGDVSYVLCDFLDAQNPLLTGRFDLLFEHTCFCAIDPSRRIDYVNAAAKALKPGGRLLAILFMDLEDDDGPPYSLSNDALEALFSPRFDLLDRWKPTRFFPGREDEETMFLMKKR